jgi:hypothetical protein
MTVPAEGLSPAACYVVLVRGKLAWIVPLAIAVAIGAAVHRGLARWSPSSIVLFSKIDIPPGWEALPVAAHLVGESVEKSESFLELYGTATFRGHLGPFAVTSREMLVRGIAAGEVGWRIESPDGSCSAGTNEIHARYPATLRVDEAAGVYVVEGGWSAGARLACRRKVIVTRPPAFAEQPDLRLAASVAAGAPFVWLAWMLREAKRSRSKST